MLFLSPGLLPQMVFPVLLWPHFSGSSPPTSRLPVVLSALLPLLHPFPFLPAAPRVHLDMHTYAHMHIFSPPLSPCGFKVLILIRFALTYCQSSFSCSSEALGSYHQDLDLGPKPCWLVHIGSPWTENKRSFASLLPMKASPQFSSCLFKIKN